MLRKSFVLALFGMLFALPAASRAVDRPFEVTLGAGASNGNDFNGFTGSANGSFGYYFTDTLEVAVRQSITYTDVGNTGSGGSAWNGSTRIALDFHIPLGDKQQIQPFIGVNIGYVYGETVSDTWEAAPEVGIKFYVTPSTFIYAQAEYQFFFDKGSNVDDGFKDGQFVYTVGIGFRF